ncbi:GNAT family N-acetyltransferase [Parachitinimonas caeni]|uniref:GNAT family protein n=1 Tax=Parachitinimonas caeni TaxID=3031301 RepID=A0ABT7E0X1_9NEIS|nr:GNAT family protein [Parachitinimonas caeni]MDK2125936.1 GNAT family protein [Parachitinimonas caeni]
MTSRLRGQRWDAGAQAVGEDKTMMLPDVYFKPLTGDDVALLEQWLEPANVHGWLDFGSGRQKLSRLQLQALVSSKKNWARFYCDAEGRPIGFMCMVDIDNPMGSAEVFGLRGDLQNGPRHITTAAFINALATGFYDLDRSVMSTWVVASNRPSIQVHRKAGLTEVGRLRHRHVMAGERLDRVCFDITREEFGRLHPTAISEQGACYADWLAEHLAASQDDALTCRLC